MLNKPLLHIGSTEAVWLRIVPALLSHKSPSRYITASQWNTRCLSTFLLQHFLHRTDWNQSCIQMLHSYFVCAHIKTPITTSLKSPCANQVKLQLDTCVWWTPYMEELHKRLEVLDCFNDTTQKYSARAQYQQKQRSNKNTADSHRTQEDHKFSVWSSVKAGQNRPLCFWGMTEFQVVKADVWNLEDIPWMCSWGIEFTSMWQTDNPKTQRLHPDHIKKKKKNQITVWMWSLWICLRLPWVHFSPLFHCLWSTSLKVLKGKIWPKLWKQRNRHQQKLDIRKLKQWLKRMQVTVSSSAVILMKPCDLRHHLVSTAEVFSC